MFYEIHYSHFVENQNARNAKIRHTERNRTIEDLLAGKKTCPEETIYQFGTLDGLALVEGKVNESKKAKIARPEQAPTDYTAYWVVRPGDKAEPSMQIPGAIIGSEEEARLFEAGSSKTAPAWRIAPTTWARARTMWATSTGT